MTNLDFASRFGLSLLMLSITFFQLNAQCTTVNSSNGYQVHVTVTPKSIQAPTSCQYGYNFNVTYDYEISFTGNNIPANLDILNGYFTCDDGSETDRLYFELPDNAGSGTITTYTNPYRSQDDCTTATPVSLGCVDYEVKLAGPGIPEQIIYCTAVLPVELGHFSAATQNGEVVLKWATWSELNNSGFEIQRASSADLESKGGRAWEKISFQEGQGTTSSVTVYTFVDEAPLAGTTYYRLKQLDHDGQYEYSPLVSVENGTTGRSDVQNDFRVFPNPVKDQIRVLPTEAGYETEDTPYALHNTLGQVVRTGMVSIDQAIDVEDLDAGVYYLTLGNSTARRTTKVVKK